ncbi:MAG: hypothetical protein AVDCRST_MAG42-50, partial [uncultured Chthoniobacterales bacterium]
APVFWRFHTQRGIHSVRSAVSAPNACAILSVLDVDCAGKLRGGRRAELLRSRRGDRLLVRRRQAEGRAHRRLRCV